MKKAVKIVGGSFTWNEAARSCPLGPQGARTASRNFSDVHAASALHHAHFLATTEPYDYDR
ncbi:hypothetical protein [Hymenobacter sp. PAMC 26628]|uniref:hypothetical protein n=1 Tax=Hymenobacter sp. PAMC 26628 TaxID=1484118 RepID=UPI0007702E1C|nr:hypothetical protein [Hymenobacter sp. PAMC 26628]AMJ66209.1 hypothetical protein AXW84_12755 [Hymenobacter sp. PAMC 26628]